MNRLKITQLLFIVLMLANCIILALFLIETSQKIKPDTHDRNLEFEKHHRVKELFAFDESQFKDFLKSKRVHGDSMRRLIGQQTLITRDYYSSYKDTVQTEINNDLLEELEEINRRIYLANMQHIKEIRDICQEDQLIYLDSFINEVLDPMPKVFKKNR